MAGSYTKRDFGAGPEEQTLLKEPSNGTRVLPRGAEPVRLSPGWEGTGRPDDELNFKGITMDRAVLELNPPRDKFKIVLFIMLLHGIGALMPWNMFINAKDYFLRYKLVDESGNSSRFDDTFHTYTGYSSQIPNFLFTWINVFMPLSGSLTTRVAWGLFVNVITFIITVVLAMIDTTAWSVDTFFWITMATVMVLNTANGFYQNSVFGMAAKLPGKYTGAVVLGSNLSGVFASVMEILFKYSGTTQRTQGIYYFITALFVLLACFDTYFALPLNRFYRYHEYLHEKEMKTKQVKYSGSSGGAPSRPSLWQTFKQCWVQCFNITFVFFVTLSIFPQLQLGIKKSDPDFPISDEYYTSFMCFLCFNITAMLGSLFASWYPFPSKRWITIPILLRALFIPAFMMCNFTPQALMAKGIERDYIYITNDYAYLALGIAMGLTSGYFSSSAMMFCSSVVEPQYASNAGMFGAAFLVTGIVSGIGFGQQLVVIITKYLARQ